MRNFSFFLVLVAGCASKPEVKPEAKEARASTASSSVEKVAAPAVTADAALKEECNNLRVHFPFNSAEIDPAELSSLEKSARCLKANAAMKITIEGNADERGTEEYNLALGDQRAHTVARYLKSLGASDAQLKTVSFGKTNPICHDHDEACWAKNRRAELKKNSN